MAQKMGLTSESSSQEASSLMFEEGTLIGESITI